MGRPVSRRLISNEDKIKIKEENMEDELRKENDTLKAQLKIAQNANDANEKVEPDTYVELISLCPTQLTLSTESKGRGFNFTWNHFGEVRQIVYSDLQKIIQNHGSGLYTDFIREGYVYINNPEVVKKSGLKDVYEKLLTKEQMEKVMACDSEECVKLFKSTFKKQQLFICTMLISKLSSGAELDLNIIDQFCRISGLDIVKQAEEAKQYIDMNLKQ
jgi:hypothetical protein